MSCFFFHRTLHTLLSSSITSPRCIAKQLAVSTSFFPCSLKNEGVGICLTCTIFLQCFCFPQMNTAMSTFSRRLSQNLDHLRYSTVFSPFTIASKYGLRILNTAFFILSPFCIGKKIRSYLSLKSSLSRILIIFLNV